MKIINFNTHKSILNQFLSELRDVDIQKDSMRFRRNIERIGEIMAYEISKELLYGPKAIKTPPVYSHRERAGRAACNRNDPSRRDSRSIKAS